MNISENIRYAGVCDREIDLFEGQYQVPNGIRYNSYVILDEQICVMDTVDRRKADAFLDNLAEILGDRSPAYLVVSHVEPDHASSLQAFLDKYPKTVLVGNSQTFRLLENYFNLAGVERKVVKEGDTLSLGAHTLRFLTAPMVHWPEVMFTYEESEQVLFSADAFGTFGVDESAAPEAWDSEARRYYFNIVGKFGQQVQAALKKTAALTVKTVCPLHGPVLTETISHVMGLYDRWSRYAPERLGVLVCYASMHGNTAAAAERFADMLDEKGCPEIMVCDLARDDLSEALAMAFCYDRVVLAASTYNTGVMPFMEDFLRHLAAKNWQGRKVGLIENGSWGPMAAKVMREQLAAMKDITIVEPVVTIKGAPKTSDLPNLEALAVAMAAE